MAKIVDPDDLNQSTQASSGTPDGNVFFDVALKEIELIDANIYPTGNSMSTDGCALQALYSFSKEEWKDDAELIKYAFPFIAITSEQFELTSDWDFISNSGITQSFDETKNLIRDAGWALKDANGDSLEEYMNITSLGVFDDSNNDQAYYLQLDGGTPSNIILSGEVNQGIKILGDIGYGNFDYTSFFKIYLREQAKIYGFGDLIADQNLSVLTYRKYALPLSNSGDIKITTADAGISIGGTQADVAPYDNMSITYYQTPQDRGGLVGGTYSFSIIIDGNNGSAEQIYEFTQWSLRQAFDIDASTYSVRGDTAEELLEFVGNTLKTKSTTSGGVYIDNFDPADTNRLVFVDDTGAERTFPFVAAGNLLFNENLTGDTDAKYWMFYTNTKELNGTDIGLTGLGSFTGSIYNAGSVDFATFSYLDYISTSAFTADTNNGVFQIIATPSTTDMQVTKVDQEILVTEAAGNSIIIGENPFGSPAAIIINDNGGTPITGLVSANSTIAFDYDYDGNTQGGRKDGTDAKFTGVSIGLNAGQYVVTTGTIARVTTNTANFVAALERNYSNPV